MCFFWLTGFKLSWRKQQYEQQCQEFSWCGDCYNTRLHSLSTAHHCVSGHCIPSEVFKSCLILQVCKFYCSLIFTAAQNTDLIPRQEMSYIRKLSGKIFCSFRRFCSVLKSFTSRKICIHMPTSTLAYSMAAAYFRIVHIGILHKKCEPTCYTSPLSLLQTMGWDLSCGLLWTQCACTCTCTCTKLMLELPLAPPLCSSLRLVSLHAVLICMHQMDHYQLLLCQLLTLQSIGGVANSLVDLPSTFCKHFTPRKTVFENLQKFGSH